MRTACGAAAAAVANIEASAQHSSACDLEGMADTQVKGRALVLRRAAIQLESDVQANRTHGRSISHAEPDGAAQIADDEILHAFEHVAAIDEYHRTDAVPRRKPELGVQDEDGIAASRKAGSADGRRRTHRVERETANR